MNNLNDFSTRTSHLFACSCELTYHVEYVDEETLKRMKYGRLNIIHAVATLVGKVLPVHFPDKVFVEAGCYALHATSTGVFLVSPDGSLRTKVKDENDGPGKTFSAVEIKCPYPGKQFTTPVQYSLPLYYVPQVLSEMVALDVDNLVFVSFSIESTCVFSVKFDNLLWKKIVVNHSRNISSFRSKVFKTTSP